MRSSVLRRSSLVSLRSASSHTPTLLGRAMRHEGRLWCTSALSTTSSSRTALASADGAQLNPAPLRGFASAHQNVPASGHTSGAAEPGAAKIEELNADNFYDLVLDKGHVKKPVFIYCFSGRDQRTKYDHIESRLKQEVRRTGGKCFMRLLDAQAHPELAKRLDLESPKHWPVVISYVRGQETRRVAGVVSDRDLGDWVHEEAWLSNV